MSIPILKAGCAAYYDSFQGLIPCRIVSIAGPCDGPKPASSAYSVVAEVSKDFRSYKKKEIIKSSSLWFPPKESIIRGKYNTKIGFYFVERNKQNA